MILTICGTFCDTDWRRVGSYFLESLYYIDIIVIIYFIFIWHRVCCNKNRSACRLPWPLGAGNQEAAHTQSFILSSSPEKALQKGLFSFFMECLMRGRWMRILHGGDGLTHRLGLEGRLLGFWGGFFRHCGLQRFLRHTGCFGLLRLNRWRTGLVR